MKNELLENYIRDNALDKFTKEYKEDLIIELKDSKSTMTLMQIFNYVVVNINGEFFNTFEKKRVLDGSMQWCVAPKRVGCN